MSFLDLIKVPLQKLEPSAYSSIPLFLKIGDSMFGLYFQELTSSLRNFDTEIFDKNTPDFDRQVINVETYFDSSTFVECFGKQYGDRLISKQPLDLDPSLLINKFTFKNITIEIGIQVDKTYLEKIYCTECFIDWNNCLETGLFGFSYRKTQQNPFLISEQDTSDITKAIADGKFCEPNPNVSMTIKENIDPKSFSADDLLEKTKYLTAEKARIISNKIEPDFSKVSKEFKKAIAQIETAAEAGETYIYWNNKLNSNYLSSYDIYCLEKLGYIITIYRQEDLTEDAFNINW